jgi:DNA-binding MarR family transcriptional regulator
MRSMSTLTAPPPTSSAAEQLATDLGDVLDTLLERTAQTLVERIQAHQLLPIHARILRRLDRSLAPLDAIELAERLQVEPRVVLRALRLLHDHELIADVATPGDPPALALTRRGRGVVADLDQARRRDLRSFVDGLDPTERRRVEAAVSLLAGEF